MTAPDRILPPPRSRLRVGVGAVVVLALAGLAVAVLVALLGGGGATREVVPTSPVSSNSSTDPAGITEDSGAGSTVIFVHLLGAVAMPGLYELRQGDRAVDAVAAAGGFSPDADPAGINLARPLVDGEQIRVPAIGEAPAIGSGDVGSSGASANGTVNLNTADAAALDTLPGVGPATAQRILDWRDENGRFTAIEDLMSVSGIGEKTFADLKDLVTV